MTTVVWDGIAFIVMDKQEAAKLVKEDKAEYAHLHYSNLRYRHQFSGYNTRELRAKPVKMVPEKIIDDEPKEVVVEKPKAKKKKKSPLFKKTKK